MTWEEKYKGFICLIYELMAYQIDPDYMKKLIENIQTEMWASPEFKYKDKKLKKLAIEFVQKLEN